MNETERFRQARDDMTGLRISDAPTTTYEQLVAMAQDLDKTFSQMDDYLGLRDGDYAKWVTTAARQKPQPGGGNAPAP